MHITQIRIAGFKSFVDPTDFAIEEGLTGIVGPNGCGKSNLLEALRWAMGASSAKALRGAELDDLIFSGSAKRPARETAQVTLLLDNTSRQAPAAFNNSDTLEVTRRAKRAKGTTYKLNGRLVRGRDIQLLFADASTGANSPALVRQGQISELIDAKPQNRRRILEEAAGIAGLNTRRHEAELKLRAAEINLDQLVLISEELARQKQSLERQARKVSKYKALSLKIDAYTQLALYLRWTEAEETHMQAEAAYKSAIAAVDLTAREAAHSETLRLNAFTLLPDLRKRESEVGARFGQARIALAKLDAQSNASQQNQQNISEELKRLDADMEREASFIAEAQEACDLSSIELNTFPDADIAVQSAEESGARSALGEAERALNTAQHQVDDIAQKLAHWRADALAAQKAIAAQKERASTLRKEADQLNAALATFSNIAKLADDLNLAKSDEAEADQALEQARHDVERHKQALLGLKSSEAAIRPRVEEARKAVRALEVEISGLKRLSQNYKTSRAAPVLEQIKVKAGYERALAAALGDDLQAPLEADNDLYWAGADRPDVSLPQGITSLGNWLQAPDALAARLSQCGLVDEGQGDAIQSQLRPGQRLVSKKGKLWRWDGFIRTPDAPLPAAERLEQKNRLESAEEKLPARLEALHSAEAELETARSDRQSGEMSLSQSQSTSEACLQSLNTARLKTAGIQQSHDQRLLQRDAKYQTFERVSRELKETMAQIDALSDQQGEERLAPQMEAELAEARQALTTAREQEMQARAALTEILQAHKALAERRTRVTNSLKAWTARLAAAQERKIKLEARQSDISSRLEKFSSERTQEEAQRTRLMTDIQQAEQAQRQAADRLAKAEAHLREAENQARTATQNASQARESLHATKLALLACEEKLADLIEMSEDQFQSAPNALYTRAAEHIGQEPCQACDMRSATQNALDLTRQREQLGGLNMEAASEAEDIGERLEAQDREKQDLTAAIAKLRGGVDALNAEGRQRLLKAFNIVNDHFKTLFTTLFQGGQAELRLIDDNDPLSCGLEIYAQPPGKRLSTLRLLSGGEQALTATALIFAVFLSNPAPICVLDEVDAPLDDANVDRFCRMLSEMRRLTETRFLVITHNAVTMSRMDRLYGITMQEQGVSKLVSVDLRDAEALIAAE